MNDMKKGEKGFKEKPLEKRKHKCIVITDPTQTWFKLARKVVEDNSNVLYPDEQTVSNFLKLCIKYGDACVQAINRQRFAADKRTKTIAEKKARALKDLEEDL